MTEQAEQPGGTESGPVWYSVPAAAQVLGISERGIRKRIAAGTLEARKDGTRWTVLVPGSGTGPAEGPEPERNRADEYSTAARNTLFRQPEQGRPLEALMAEWIIPLVDRIAGLERAAGTRDAQIAQLQADKDALAAALAAKAAEIAEFQRSAVSSPTDRPDGAISGSWWARLRSRFFAIGSTVV